MKISAPSVGAKRASPSLFRQSLLGFVISLLILLPFYLFTLQTIPNGSDEPPMIDVGETQVVLNVWGTLHATGYPLYVMLSAALVSVLKAVGLSAAAAPAVTSLLWGIAALAVIYTLAVHLTRRVLPAIILIILFGLTRNIWLHHAIAEIYTFGLLITALLLLVALWKGQIRGRIYWLALIGGLGVGHHRAILMLAPALIYALWSEKLWRTIPICILLGLVGLLPYLYLPLRANADAIWVYGDPSTLDGLWDQFIGREASRFIGIGAPSSLIDNFNRVNTALLADLTAPGLIIGLAGLILAARTLRHRRASVTFLLTGSMSYGFHVLFYSDILAALILQITLSLAFGWLFVFDWLFVRAIQPEKMGNFQFRVPLWVRGYVIGVAALFALLLIAQNILLIRSMTHDTTGLRTIETAKQAEPGSTLMIAWGTRHFAVGFARDVLNELPSVALIDHNADLQAQIPLLTLSDTFYSYPPDWWNEHLGQPAYLRSPAPGLVEIDIQPEMRSDLPSGISLVDETISCTTNTYILRVAWASAEPPEQNLSVFVHLLDSSGRVLAQADQSAPVYGWRPLTTWQAGEVVRDAYALPRHPDAAQIRYGLYRQLDSGAFQNEYEYEVMPTCN